MACIIKEKRFLLLYGSQTGQAEAIAEEVRARATEKGYRPVVSCLSQSEKKVCACVPVSLSLCVCVCVLVSLFVCVGWGGGGGGGSE